MIPSIRWIYLGIGSLAISGLYSIALVLLRSPWLSNIIDKDLFRIALVIHVNLSVLVWLLSAISSLWFYNVDKKYNYFICYANYLALVGLCLMSVSPLVGESEPILNNYVPMVDNFCFVLGLVFFACAIVFAAIVALFSNHGANSTSLKIANISSATITLVMMISFVLSYFALERIPYEMDMHFYYESFFWGGGHILQFIFVQGAMIVWLLLFENALGKKLYYQKIYKVILALNTLLVIPSLYPYYAYQIDSVEFIEFFTAHMKYCGGIAPSLMLIVLLSEYKTLPAGASKNCLIASLGLFFLGGMIGLLISGINVTIPAHYHGSIVGISIAFMGFVYMVLEVKKDSYQPYIYAIGQTLHIIGLAVSGGYGVMRKLPGGELALNAKIAMGIMGFGGMLAVIGGLMFVYICGKRIINGSGVLQ
jgi:cytochrome c oxidase subunit 1